MKIKNENEVITIEQKAQRYDEALEKAHQLCAYPTTKPFISDLQDLFPELAESEDEKIRREIINYFKCQTRDEPSRKDIHNKWINWLEKQADKDKLIKELSEYKVKYAQEVLENHINSMSNKDNERLRKAEEKGYEAYPVSFYEGITVDVNEMPKDVFVKGYQQAEKDLQLTWEDIRELYIVFAEVDAEIELCMVDIKSETIGYYQEVLKRFKTQKGE